MRNAITSPIVGGYVSGLEPSKPGNRITLPSGKIKRVVVNRHMILKNRKHGTKEPPVSVHQSGKPVTRGHTVILHGHSTVRYTPDKPLSCGAELYIETTRAVTVWPDPPKENEI